ncbi:MAG: hypothetical protein B0D92_07305 [Spirochaeta sp. LUC14_002_19_P3]|nr:MAG: hypothetical protein B0D92_07305 [Spirochaeta sp. LUC14_002_19_P3]
MTYLLKDDPIRSGTVTAYRTSTRNRELMEQYEARMKRLSDEATRIGIAYDEGFKEGRDEALKKVRDAALKETTRATAQKMKMAGADTAFIMKITGLSADEIGTL